MGIYILDFIFLEISTCLVYADAPFHVKSYATFISRNYIAAEKQP